jgi:hypothetical protein
MKIGLHQIFYPLLALVSYNKFSSFFKYRAYNTSANDFYSLFNTGGDLGLYFKISAFVFFFLCIVSLITTNYLMRILIALSFLFLHSALPLLGYRTYSLYAWAFAVIVLIFMNKNVRIQGPQPGVEIVQAIILAFYFSSGLWKLRSAFSSSSFWEYFSSIRNLIAYSIAQGDGPMTNLQDPDLLKSNFLIIGFILVILFQLGAIIPLIFKRWLPIWGLMAILFHFSTGAFMNIWFGEQILADLFFLILLSPFVTHCNLKKEIHFLKQKIRFG